MASLAHEWVDSEILAVKLVLAKTYAKSKGELSKITAELFEDFDVENGEMLGKVESGIISADEYDIWLDDKTNDFASIAEAARRIAAHAALTDEKASKLIADSLVVIYSEVMGMTAYEIEKAFSVRAKDIAESLSYGASVDTVPALQLDKDKDFAWNSKKAFSAIVGALVMGAGSYEVFRRMSLVYDMNNRTANRILVTSATATESTSIIDMLTRLSMLGVPARKRWVAVLDNRTRMTHRELDGQVVDVSEPFVIESTGETIRFPADPKASPQETYNCRCGIEPVIGQGGLGTRISQLPKDLTYEDWKAGNWPKE